MIKQIQIFLLFALIDFLDFSSIHHTYILNKHWKALYSRCPKIVENRFHILLTFSTFDPNQLLKWIGIYKEIRYRVYNVIHIQGLLSLCSSLTIQQGLWQYKSSKRSINLQTILSSLKYLKEIHVDTLNVELVSILNAACIPIHLTLSEVDNVVLQVPIKNVVSLEIKEMNILKKWTRWIDMLHLTKLAIDISLMTNQGQDQEFVDFIQPIEHKITSLTIMITTSIYETQPMQPQYVQLLFSSLQRMKSLRRLKLYLHNGSSELAQLAFQNIPDWVEHLGFVLGSNVSMPLNNNYPNMISLSMTVNRFIQESLFLIFPNVESLKLTTRIYTNHTVENNQIISILSQLTRLKTIDVLFDDAISYLTVSTQSLIRQLSISQ